jgi:hypothetical protein
MVTKNGDKRVKTKCVHHWFIDDQGWGVCKRCGGRQKFPLTLYEVYRDNSGREMKQNKQGTASPPAGEVT